MTDNANLKRRIRARAARTGESYTAARRHLQPPAGPGPSLFSIAVAQTVLRPDPRSRQELAESGSRVRDLIRDAAAAGASLVHFPEGTLTSPNKRTVSSNGPDTVAEADWSTVDQAALTAEIAATAEAGRELGIWVVVGGIAFHDGLTRPLNSLFVFSGRGALAGRYDERMLSHTKSSFMYRAGSKPLIFTVNGMRFGCSLGMESQYPELFAEYERAGVDCVLLSTAGNPELPEVFAIEAAGHAATNSFWISYSGPSHRGEPPAGVISPGGDWVAKCPAGEESIAIATIDPTVGAHARVWRRTARAAAVDYS